MAHDRTSMTAALSLALAATLHSAPAGAIDVYNCTPFSVKVEFYNESDRLELIHKKQINVDAGSAAVGASIPGDGTHKIKLFSTAGRNRHLVTLQAIEGNGSYVLISDPSGAVTLTGGAGC